MGLFDPVRIPAQAGDWLMLESYDEAEPECVRITFLPIIAWRKEGEKAYVPEFLNDVWTESVTKQSDPRVPWNTVFIRGGLVMRWNGNPSIELWNLMENLAKQYRIHVGSIPMELRDEVRPAVERSLKLHPH